MDRELYSCSKSRNFLQEMEKYASSGASFAGFNLGTSVGVTAPGLSLAAPTVPAGGQVYTYGPNGELVQKN